MIDTDFDGFTIDETKIGDLLMFRMAECITAILVHEKVRRGLETARHPLPGFLRTGGLDRMTGIPSP